MLAETLSAAIVGEFLVSVEGSADAAAKTAYAQAIDVAKLTKL